MLCLRGLLPKSVLSAAEFTLGWEGAPEDQLSLPQQAQGQPCPVQVSQSCAAGALSPAVLQELHYLRGGQAASQGALPLLGIC